MKKRLLVCLCTFAIALGMTACGSSEDDGTIGGRAVDEYYNEASTMMQTIGGLDEAMIQYNIEALASYEDGAVLIGLLENYEECYDAQNSFVQFYNDNAIIGGVNIGSYNFGGSKAFSVEKSGKTITATLVGDFSKRDLKLTYVYKANDVDAGPTAINIEPVYSLGETMQKAGLNTVMGILIVFFMLVVMSGVIKAFEIIPMLEKKAKAKKETPEVVAPVASPVVSSENKTDDLQLVAVIAAAIAASTGASTDSFVVRSIKKR